MRDKEALIKTALTMTKSIKQALSNQDLNNQSHWILLIFSCYIFGVSGLGCSRIASLEPFSKNWPDVSLPSTPLQSDTVRDSSIQERSIGLHSYIIGQLLYNKENYQDALTQFKQASRLLKDIEAPALRLRLAELALRAGDLNQAYQESSRALSSRPNDPTILTLHAGVLDAQGKLQEALVLYERLIKEYPNTTEIYLVTASLYLRLGRTNEAVELLQKLTASYPDEPTIYLLLGRAFEQSGKIKKATKAFETAWRNAQGNSRIGLELIRILLKNGYAKKAQAVCEEILGTQPEHLEARRILGILLADEKKWDEALSHLKIVEKSEEDATETRLQIALLHLERKRPLEAEVELSLILAANPQHAEARFYRGTIYAGLGRMAEALQDLLAVLPSSSLYERSRMFASFLIRETGNLSSAEQVLRDGISQSPTLPLPQLHHYLISILREAGKLSEAVDEAEQLLKLRPTDTKLLFDYGMILFENGREEKAEQTMLKVLEIDNNHPEALNYLAYANAEAGKDLTQALERIQRALKNKPLDPYFLDTLGWVHFKRKEYQKALEALKKAVSLVSSEEDPVLLDHLADVYTSLGKTKKAQKLLEKAHNILEEKSNRDKEAQKLLENIQKKLKAFQ